MEENKSEPECSIDDASDTKVVEVASVKGFNVENVQLVTTNSSLADQDHEVKALAFDPNAVVPLSEINRVDEIVSKIRVVVVKEYPILYYGIDENGTRVMLNITKCMYKQCIKSSVSGSSQLLDNRDFIINSCSILPNQRVFRVRVVDHAAYKSSDWTVSAIINLTRIRPDEEPGDMVGQSLELTDLRVEELTDDQEKVLTDTSFYGNARLGKQFKFNENFERRLSTVEMITCSNFKPPFGEFDFLGLVCSVGFISRYYGQPVKLVDQSEKSLLVQFDPCMQVFKLGKILSPGNIVGFENLSMRNGIVRATNKTSVYLEPDTGIFKDPCAKLKIDSEWLKEFFFDIPPTLTEFASDKPEFEVAAKLVDSGSKQCIDEEFPPLTEDQKQSLEGLKSIIVPIATGTQNPLDSQWDRFLCKDDY